MNGAGGPRYELRVTGPATRALAGRLPEKVATAVSELITTTLLDQPRRVGKPLALPPYAGTWSARRGSYRVLYQIDDGERVVTVTAIEHRGRVPVALTGPPRGVARASGGRLRAVALRSRRPRPVGMGSVPARA